MEIIEFDYERENVVRHTKYLTNSGCHGIGAWAVTAS